LVVVWLGDDFLRLRPALLKGHHRSAFPAVADGNTSDTFMGKDTRFVAPVFVGIVYLIF